MYVFEITACHFYQFYLWESRAWEWIKSGVPGFSLLSSITLRQIVTISILYELIVLFFSCIILYLQLSDQLFTTFQLVNSHGQQLTSYAIHVFLSAWGKCCVSCSAEHRWESCIPNMSSSWQDAKRNSRKLTTKPTPVPQGAFSPHHQSMQLLPRREAAGRMAFEQLELPPSMQCSSNHNREASSSLTFERKPMSNYIK